MNFESAFEKYKNGTATEEEKAFVESEIEKARKLSEIIDAMDAKRVIDEAKPDEVKAVIKKAKKKSGIRTAIISLIVVMSVILLTAVAIFTYVNVVASGNAEYDRTACVEAAKQVVIDKTGAPAEDLVVGYADKELTLEQGKLSSVIYVYEIEIRYDGMEYEVVVNSRNGKAVIEDIDSAWD